MRLTVQSGLFVAESSFEERAAPKAAGFRWCGGNCNPMYKCQACPAGLRRVWWTSKTECAARLVEYATDEARALLTPHVEKVQASWATDCEAIEIPAPEGQSYLPYQRAGIAYASQRPNTLIADEMGLGKTIQAIGVLNLDPTVKTMLVICPASLRINWRRELVKWSVRPIHVEIVDDEHPLPGDALAEGIHVVVVNYDRVRKTEVHDLLMARSWDMMVVDEAHRIKNPKTKQAKAILGYEEEVKAA